MAGGKSTRFSKDIGKTMIELLGKSLIKMVIEATKASKKISETYVAVTSYNSQTASARGARAEDWYISNTLENLFMSVTVGGS